VSPWLEYRCACTNEFEQLRSFKDLDSEVVCPNCERVGKVSRLVSVPMQSRVEGATGAGKDAYKPR
jgi:putative FmdB family regulatory protein